MKSLFGRKKAPPQGNPYAQQLTEDEYERMTPYQRSRPDLDNNNAPRPSVAGGLPSGPGPRRDYNASPSQSAQSFGGSTYVEPPSQGYSSNQYGSNQGYGSSRFDSNSTAFSANQAAPPARDFGYGGLGGRPQDFADNGYTRKPQPPGGAPDRYAAGGNEPYADEDENDYADEELTEDQLQEREYRKLKTAQFRERTDQVELVQRTVAKGRQVLAVGDHTLANLAAQSERLNRVDLNLSMSASHARTAETKTKELKHANRSIFNPSIQNPMTKKSRIKKEEDAYLAQNQAERREREAIRGEGYRQRQQAERFGFQMSEANQRGAKQQHKDDWDSDCESDDSATKEKKKQFGEGMSELEDITQQLYYQSLTVKERIQSQNDTLDRLGEKTDGVTDHVVKNSAKLRTFK